MDVRVVAVRDRPYHDAVFPRSTEQERPHACVAEVYVFSCVSQTRLDIVTPSIVEPDDGVVCPPAPPRETLSDTYYVPNPASLIRCFLLYFDLIFSLPSCIPVLDMPEIRRREKEISLIYKICSASCKKNVSHLYLALLIIRRGVAMERARADSLSLPLELFSHTISRLMRSTASVNTEVSLRRVADVTSGCMACTRRPRCGLAAVSKRSRLVLASTASRK